MKFDYVIGNPPYQEETESDSTRMPPVYNLFMDETYKIAEKAELITPARFLFDTGFTPKAWNQKMLNDPHLKILWYEPESNKIFSGTTITAGIVVSYKDNSKVIGPIGIFTKYLHLNEIVRKVNTQSTEFMDSIVYPSLNYDVSEKMIQENGHLINRLRTSAFTTLAEIFYDELPDDSDNYISMIGLLNGKRTTKYVRRDYIKDKGSILDKYNLLLSEANGAAGQIGTPIPARIVGVPIISEPGCAYTQTFIGIGAFDNIDEANNASKYIKSKFARVMVGVKKATQHTPRPVWQYVPLQNFTPSSDIDWSLPIPDIDRQLYRKYGLTDEEIAFIESHVKEMT